MKGVSFITKKIFILFISLVFMTILTLIYLNKGYDVIETLDKYCHHNNAYIELRKIIPIEWDSLYIVYGPSLSDFLEWDYNIESKKNVTGEHGISLYFVSKNKVVYVENNDNFKNRREGDIYIKFNDKSFKFRNTSRSSPAAIYYRNTILRVENSLNSFDPSFPACKLTPITQPD